ncbi:MAG: protein TolR [Deltaproteobacteria bacterium]|nr:protein TolR [Deltaproteobacteria bacterium]
MAISSSGGDEPVANINVTPLVDVMLVLLVIFMVTAPMLQQGVEVNLPKATTAPLPGTNEQVVVSIDKESRIFLGAGNEVAIDQLAAKVTAILSQRPANEQKVYIKADTSLEYGNIMQVMSRLHEGGVTQIGLVSAFPGNEPKGKRS